jgi:TRAP-type C4-dicarboxylate transport system permease small subunit
MVRFSRAVANVAFIALLGMIAVTLTDIVLRIVSRAPMGANGNLMPAAVPGVVDLVELALVTVAHLSIAVAFLAGSHVTVDIVAVMLPERFRRMSRRVGWAVCLSFMAACLLEAFRQGRLQFASAVVSATISLPIWWYWIPVVVGTALSTAACAILLLRPNPTEDDGV